MEEKSSLRDYRFKNKVEQHFARLYKYTGVQATIDEDKSDNYFVYYKMFGLDCVFYDGNFKTTSEYPNIRHGIVMPNSKFDVNEFYKAFQPIYDSIVATGKYDIVQECPTEKDIHFVANQYDIRYLEIYLFGKKCGNFCLEHEFKTTIWSDGSNFLSELKKAVCQACFTPKNKKTSTKKTRREAFKYVFDKYNNVINVAKTIEEKERQLFEVKNKIADYLKEATQLTIEIDNMFGQLQNHETDLRLAKSHLTTQLQR